MFSIIYPGYVTCHTQWAWVTYEYTVKKTHKMRRFSGLPFWNESAAAPQLWHYFALSKTLVPQVWQKIIAELKRKSKRWRQPKQSGAGLEESYYPVPSQVNARASVWTFHGSARFLRKGRSLFQRRRLWLFQRKSYISTEQTHLFIRRIKWLFLPKKHSTVQRTIAAF